MSKRIIKKKTFRVCIVPNCKEAVHKSKGFRCYQHRKENVKLKEQKLMKLKTILEK